MKKLPLFLVLLLSFLTWWKLSLITIRGDGFVYLIDNYNRIYFQHFLRNLTSFDWSAVLFGEILSNLFKTNFSLYGWTEVVFLLATVALFYWSIFTVTKNRLVAFSASLILGTSYYGNWDMYAGGIFPWFLERIPLMILLIPSFTFLHLFLEKQKRKYYLYSILLYTLGVWISHWGIIFIGIYIFYPFFWSRFNSKKTSKNYLLISFSYILVSSIFFILQKILGNGVGPSWGFIEFLTHPFTFNYISDMVSQLVYWTTYLPFIELVLSGFVKSPITTFVVAKTSLVFTPYILIIYLGAFIYTYKNLPKYRPLFLTVVVSLLSIFFLNAYFGQYHIPTQPGPSRYLYLPTYLLAIFWTFFLWSAFWIKKNKFYYVGHFVLFAFFTVNFWLVSENFKWNMETYTKTKNAWYLAIDTASKAPAGSTIVIPNQETGRYEAQFLTDQFLNKEITFVSDIDEWEKVTKANSKIFKIEYDSNCNCAVSLEWQKIKK